MSQPRGFGLNGKSIYMNIANPKEVELNFTVDATNGNGLGVRSIKSNGYVNNVFMITSASMTGTVATTANAITSISGGTASLRVGMPVQGTGIPAGTVITGITSSSAVAISATPTGNHSSESITYQGVGLNNIVNPNPAAGLIMVQFKNNFNYSLSGSNSIVSPITSPTTSTTSGLTSGASYVITVLGTTTLAEWQSIGLMPGLTPTVGQTIVVPTAVTGTGGSHTGKVGIPGVSGVFSFETVGDPNQSISNSSVSANGGAWVVLQCLAPTVASVATTPAVTNAYFSPMIPTAPANNTVLAFRFRFDGSTVSIPDGGPSNSSTSGGI